MSFDPYVPCNCRRAGKVSWPPFKDKLEIRNGIIDLKSEFVHDLDLESKYDAWTFCEHNQLAIEISMAQSIKGWKESVKEQYPNRFPNFENFIPIYNDLSTHDYDKQTTVEEIEDLKTLVDNKFHVRLNQFIELLQKAIELDQNIYW